MNTDNLNISVNNLLYALGLSNDYETKTIDNCCSGSDVKIIERYNTFKVLDF